MSRYPERVQTPTILQMEATECGAVSLAIVLAHYRLWRPLEELRDRCGVSRSGSSALGMIEAAESYGCEADGFQADIPQLQKERGPLILFWAMNHFVVFEGMDAAGVFINDPETGPRKITHEEFSQGYTGVLLKITPGPNFVRAGHPPSVVGGIRRLLRRAWSGPLLTILIATLLVLPELAIPALSQIFIDRVLILQEAAWKPWILGAMGIAVLLMWPLSLLRGRILSRLFVKLYSRSNSMLLWNLLRLPLGFFKQRFPGAILYLLHVNRQVSYTVATAVSQVFINGLQMVFYLAVMLVYDLWIPVITVMLAYVTLRSIAQLYRGRIDAYCRLQNDLTRSYGHTVSSLQNIEAIKATGREDSVWARQIGLATLISSGMQSIGRKDIRIALGPEILTYASQFLILGVGGWRVMAGSITIGMLFALQLILQRFLAPLFHLIAIQQDLHFLRGDLQRINDVADQRPDPLLEEPNDPTTEEIPGTLKLQNVTFSYRGSSTPTIDDLSLEVRAGEWIAIVGPTGCGKSTLLHLIAGLLAPASGVVEIGGKPLPTLTQNQLRTTLGFDTQDTHLFDASIGYNITLGDQRFGTSDIQQSLESVCLDKELREKPGGLEYRIGEGGANLSGGQRQRLDLAHSLIRKPRLLLLDEATSALDADMESQVMQNVRRIVDSAVVVSHRLSSIRDCDRIYVMDKGRIVQQGTHDQLLQQEGLYRELVRV